MFKSVFLLISAIAVSSARWRKFAQTGQIMSAYGSCRIGSANDGEKRILMLPIRHNRERQNEAKEGQDFVAGFKPGALLLWRFGVVS